MAYEMVMPYHLHMPSYFLETFTEYPLLFIEKFYFASTFRLDNSVSLWMDGRLFCFTTTV